MGPCPSEFTGSAVADISQVTKLLVALLLKTRLQDSDLTFTAYPLHHNRK